MTRPIRIRAITLWQPYATAIALGYKVHETRDWRVPSWATGLVAIHAAARKITRAEIASFKDDADTYGWPDWFTDAPLGAVVALAELGRCIPATLENASGSDDLALGWWTRDRRAWPLRNVRPLVESIPAQGFQGFWKWETPPGFTLPPVAHPNEPEGGK